MAPLTANTRSWLVALTLASTSACLTNIPDDTLGSIYVCETNADCPPTQSCLLQLCENIELPRLEIQNPEDGRKYTHVGPGADPHVDVLTVSAENLILRRLSESAEAVPGEGHLVVFIDEVEVAVIDAAEDPSGVLIPIEIPDIPGVHRIRVQARLNDGTNYDGEQAATRNLVWVDDGEQHVALRKPWPGDRFSLEDQAIEAEVATIGGLVIGPPMTMREHVHIYYDKVFPECIDIPLCQADRRGVVPEDDDQFGPVFLPAADQPGPVTLTALVAEFDHTLYTDDNEMPVYSFIEIIRE